MGTVGSGGDDRGAPRDMAAPDRPATGRLARGPDPGAARDAGGECLAAGVGGSGWGTLLAPYDLNGVYAHHPPLINLLHVITAGILGGDQPWHLRVPGYVAGLATLVAVAMLLRVLELGWVPTLLAVGAMAATPMFWVYGRLGAGFSVLAGFAALVAHLRRRARPGRGAVVTATVLALPDGSAVLAGRSRWGFVLGLALAAARLRRCQPLGAGGMVGRGGLARYVAVRIRGRRRFDHPGERACRRDRSGWLRRAPVVVRHRVVHLVVAVAPHPGAGGRSDATAEPGHPSPSPPPSASSGRWCRPMPRSSTTSGT